MPVDPALRRVNRPRLLLVGDSPRIDELAQTLTERSGVKVSVVRSNYEAGAEVARSKPDAMVIDMEASSDPLGLCRWVGDSAEDVSLVMIGNGDGEGSALAAGADLYVTGESLVGLRRRITALLT
jgi:DNA-binding response OmpR family regulator